MKPEQAPLVSVLTATYNRGDVLPATLESIFAQTYRPIEVIIVDDGSTDHTEQVVEQVHQRWEQDREIGLRYIKQPNAGQAAALDVAFRESQGDYIQFLDSDDLLGAEKLSHQVAAMSRLPRRTLSYGNWRYFEEGDDGFVVYEPHRSVNEQRALTEWLGMDSFAPPHSLLWRRDDVLENGSWDSTICRNEDGEYVMRFLLAGGSLKFCPASWVYYRNWLADEGSKRTKMPIEGIRSLMTVLKRVEEGLGDRSVLPEYRRALAVHYGSIAGKAWVTAPDLSDICYRTMRSLWPDENLMSGSVVRVLADTLGFSATKRVIRRARALLRVSRRPSRLSDHMRTEAKVLSATDIVYLDASVGDAVPSSAVAEEKTRPPLTRPGGHRG